MVILTTGIIDLQTVSDDVYLQVLNLNGIHVEASQI